MRRIASSDVDHRRGLVLGLTMAEVLILLLFVLLLATAAAMARKDRTIERLTSAAPDPLRLTQLVERAEQLEQMEARARRVDPNAPPEATIELALRRAATAIEPQRLAQLNERSERLGRLEERARRIDPNAAPEATMELAMRRAAASPLERVQALEASERTLTGLEAAARAVTPNAPPQQTIRAALSAQQRRAPSSAPTANSVLAVVRDTEQRLGERLREEFAADLTRWSADIDPSNLSLRFNNSDILFAPGQSALRPAFQSFMREFFPRYLARLQEFREDIEDVRIEGHTSAEWGGSTSPQDAYFRNMALSQERTREVLQFGLTQTGLAPEIREWAQGRITANGLSSSRLRTRPDGSEDRDASRRVEFRVVMRLRERMMQVVPE